jgi:hypothetical protein
MSTPLRALLVEDNEDDALLTLRELRKGGFETEWLRVDNRADMERAVTQTEWDVVICDHMMPCFSSAGALDVLRKFKLDLPFIIVSGAAPEDVVTAAMRRGAHDFIAKDNLVRLVPVVQRELKEAALRLDRRRIHDRLRESEQRMAILAAAMEQVAEAIAITEPGGAISYVNRAFETLSGFSGAQLQDCPLTDILGHPELGEALAQAAGGMVWQGRLKLRPEGATPMEVDATISPVRDPEQRVRNLVAVIRDVTKEIELERQLRQVQKMDALGVLAAGIAHDFNNVLTTVLLSAEALRDGLPEDSPLQPRAAAIIQAGLFASGLAKQILAFSRKSEEKRVPLDLTVVVREALHALHGTIPSQIDLVDELVSGLWVEGDPVLLHQVVLNLGINAIHAMMPKGGRLQVILAEEPGERGGPASAVLTVRDTGCGMEPKLLERIFEPFFTTKAAGEGTGLGLAMVHATVTKAGGRISVQSSPGRGSTFRIQLPLATGQGLAEARPAALTEAGPREPVGSERILFVDDDDLLLGIAGQGLQQLGYRVSCFTDPEKALAAFRQDPEGCDLAFLDLAMPGLDGMELGRRLQEIRPGLPMLLVTGHVATGQIPPAAHAVFQGIVGKPFSVLDLANALRRLLAGPRPTSPARPAGPRPRILLADDSHVTRSMLRNWLEGAGYAVEEARDGQDAWEAFGRAGQSGRFDLLLTDVVMPRMDGFELFQRVHKADPALPVAVLTSNEDRETVKSALHLGVNEFLNKPFDRAQLLASVAELLSERSSRLDAQRSQETAQAVRLAQRSMVATPEKGVPLFTLYQPLTDAGGDVFRCFKCLDGSVLFVLADVAGHSVLSSYAVASFLGMLSSYVGECHGLLAQPPRQESAEAPAAAAPRCGRYGHVPCDRLRHLADKLNQGIQGGPFAEVPVCALFGLWTPADGRLRLLNAGIPHGCHYRRRDGAAVALAINGTPLGVFPETLLECVQLDLEPGDRLLFGTDGFFEVPSPDGRPFQDSAPGQWSALAASPLDWALSVVCQAARDHGAGLIADDLLVVGFEQPSLTASRDDLALQVPANAQAIDMACDRMREWLRAAELESSRLFDVLLAVREALSNAVLHGNRCRPGSSVSLYCRFRAELRELEVAVQDEGPGFDLDAQVPPGDPLSERGRGLPLIRHLAQGVRMDGKALIMNFLLEEKAHDDR